MPLNFDPRPPERRTPDDLQQPREGRYTWLALAAAGLVALGSMLPWATIHSPFGSVSLAGTEGDGVISLVGAAVFAAVWLLAGLGDRPGQNWMIVAVALAAGGIVLAIVKIIDVQSAIDELGDEFVTTSVGVGLWVVLIGSAAALVACLKTLRR